MMGRAKIGALGLGLLLAAGLGAATATGSRAGPSKVETVGCQLGANGKIKHVIYLQFDNTHFLRDDPNVPSDLEQMPNLLNFITNNGTLLSNHHTVLISHTATGILTSLSGVYPDRHGIAVSNTYRYFKAGGASTNSAVSFGYWTSQVPTLPGPAASADNTHFNMITPGGLNAPAPWVPYTRAGCDVGSVAAANTILENTGIDLPTVFDAGSPQALEGTSNPAQAQADFVGIGVHCAQGSAVCSAANGGRGDSLPNEPTPGYTGYKGLFGARYVNAFLAGVAPPALGTPNVALNDLNGNPIQDSGGRNGFPGFDGMFAATTLSYVASMQEKGIPVTYGYISDAHDAHGNSGDIHVAYGPGQAGYRAQLQAYDDAFGKFFTRLAADGINKSNTLFVFTVDEGDHFVGSDPTPAGCDGVAVECHYGNIGEVNGDLKKMVATYNASHGTTATTDFSVHSDDAPTVYVNGNPGPADAKARNLERAVGDMVVTNPYTGEKGDLMAAMADPVEEKTLHMVTAGDASRTPTFTYFADPEYFLFASSTVPCAGNNLDNCVFIPTQAPPSTQTFAWNHGDIQDEIATAWLGMVGPGVKKNRVDDRVWSDHTDTRPTMLSVLGLKDDYQSDGRVITDILDDGAMAKSLKAHGGTVEALGRVYKQLNAPYGEFGMDTLTASTAALASSAPADSTYNETETAIDSLTTERDALAIQIKNALGGAEFNNQPIDEHAAKDMIDHANDLLGRASDLAASSQSNAKKLKKIKHFVVIYEENHSFDNLYGGWEGVNGLSNADAAHTQQVGQDTARTTLPCLPQDDVNLQAPLAGDACGTDATKFANRPFRIDDYLAPADLSCPPSPSVAFTHPNGWPKSSLNPDHGSAGGCTRDIVHRFYQEQYQLDGGRQDRYVVGSDAAGLVMGTYDTKALPIYAYLHGKDHPHYAILDEFFQAAFGGSFLNHQWLIAAATPVDPSGAAGGAHAGLHSVLDANGMPVLRQPPAAQLATALYTSPALSGLVDGALTQTCPATNGLACGNYAVNTMQPFAAPFSSFGAQLPAQNGTTIGDELTGAGIDWAWYAGGWNDAVAGTPDALFQFHHQPFAYYANYGPSGSGRSHLQDEVAFENLAAASSKRCRLLPVSFVKPIGEENEHPGYASEPLGSNHLVSLIQSIENGKCRDETMIVVTYDEFGGQWDHVPPPGTADGPAGPHDQWGPGTRVPTLIISPDLKGEFVVDGAEHDTTSILATIEHRYELAPLGSRDAAVNDLSTVFNAKGPKGVH
jgi:acid phosphatase